MSALRNFRKILDIDPDSPEFHCVGVTQKGKRCGQKFLRNASISRARFLLSEMDTQPLEHSYHYLEELAFNTLCPRWHTKPGYSQVGTVAQLWTQKIRQLEREEARMAKNFVIKQPVTRMAEASEEIEASIKEIIEEIPSMQADGSSAIVKATDLIDPFVTESSAAHASVPETPFTQRLKESRAITSEASSHNNSLHRSNSNKTEVDITDDSLATLSRISNLPSPPDTPLVQRQRVSHDLEDERRQPVLLTEFEGNIPERNDSPQPFKSDYFGSTQPQRPPIQVDLQFQPATLPSNWPVTPEVTPKSHLQRREVSNFVVPYTSTTMCEGVHNSSNSESKEANTGHVEDMIEGMPAPQAGDQVEAGNANVNTAAAPVTPGDEAVPIGVSKAPSGDEIPQTPGEENFGYVVITSSTRSGAYLPATQRYGLMTPPDEPNAVGTAAANSDVPVIDYDRADTPYPVDFQQTAFKIPRKPVSPTARHSSNCQPVQKNVTARGNGKATREVPTFIRPVSIIDSSPTATSEGENARVGCLGGHHIRRLKEKVVEKVQDIRQRRRWANVKVPIIKD